MATYPPHMDHWDHNNHYHGELLRALPKRIEQALDVGCGRGRLAAELARRAEHVDALDADPAVIDAAKQTYAHLPQVHFMVEDVMTAALPRHSYDVVTAIASLHHLELDAGLRRVAELLKPEGIFAVIGLAREASLLDHAYSAASVPVNWLHRTFRRSSASADPTPMRLREPEHSLEEVASAARRVFAGVQIHRRLLWRYLMFCRQPRTD